MSRPGYNETSNLDARIAALRRAVLQAERTLARETKNREIPCHCQGGDLGGDLGGGLGGDLGGGYMDTQADFEEVREMFETARAGWLAEHKMKTDVGLIEEMGDV